MPRYIMPTSYSSIFDNVVLGLIILSSITLVMEDPLGSPDSDMKITLNYLETIFTLLFLLEALIKIVAKGLLFSSLPI